MVIYTGEQAHRHKKEDINKINPIKILVYLLCGNAS